MSAHFRTTDPLNPVHMMSFSGARGNVSQVHQLVGMRGLMSNPQGNIIDLPIQSNLREGLSLTEYIISCYGARKGVVDTAVRTADAGYLTRRLVEVVQHIVVRNRDCHTLEGVRLRSIKDGKTSSSLLSLQDRLVGRILARDIYTNGRCIAVRNQDLAPDVINRLVLSYNEIFVRSPLTCKSMPRACQMCYGWDLSCGHLVELGTAIGIIAGQSIGEPGTQLTLRTFHTGGVFTGDVAEHVRAPFNGVVHFYTNTLQSTRNRHGRPAWTCPEALAVVIEDGTKKKHILNVPQYSLLLVRNHQYVQARQIIAEVRASTAPLKEKIEKEIYCGIEGEVFYEYTGIHAYCLKQRKLLHSTSFQTRLSLWLDFTSLRNYLSPIVDKTSYIWIFSGQLIEFVGINVSFFYRVQDYIQADLPIGKENHVLTQYHTLDFSSQYLEKLRFSKATNRQPILGYKTGLLYLMSEQDKSLLILSSLDQFHMKLENTQTQINRHIQNNNSKKPNAYSFASLLKIFLVTSNREYNKNDEITLNIFAYPTHIRAMLGFLGNFETSFEKLQLLALKNFLTLVTYYSYRKYKTLFIKPLLYLFSSQNSLKVIVSTLYYGNSTRKLTRIKNWILSKPLFSWIQSFILKSCIYQEQPLLGQFICKGVSTLACEAVPESGHVLGVSQDYLTIRLAKLYLVPAGTIVHTYHKQTIHEGDTLITFAYERLKASDIIQGLPKAEQLLEARIGNQVVVHLHMRFEYLVGLIKEKLRHYVSCLPQMDTMLSQASVNRARKALEYSQIETVDQIQKVYLSQGVYISDKHVEVIVRQMSSKVVIVENTDLTAFSPKTIIRTAYPYDTIGIFFPGELIDIAKAEKMNRVLHKPLPCKPVLLGITKASLNTNSFLSEASFERTITVLSKSAIQGRMDWLKGLKENVLLSNMIPAGTGCQQVDLQAILYKNKQLHLKHYKRGIFSSKYQRMFSLYKPLFPAREWMHNYLKQMTQHKMHEDTQNIMLTHATKNFFSSKKNREYTIFFKKIYNINNKK